jgi:hypothetical protein
MSTNKLNDIQKFVQLHSNKTPLTLPLAAPVTKITTTVSSLTNTKFNLNLSYVPYINGSFLINEYKGRPNIADTASNATAYIGTTILANKRIVSQNTKAYSNLTPNAEFYYHVRAYNVDLTNANANVDVANISPSLIKNANVIVKMKNIQPVINATVGQNDIKFTWSSTLVPKQKYRFNFYDNTYNETLSYVNDQTPSNVITASIKNLIPNTEYIGYVETFEQDNILNVTGNTSIYLKTSSLVIPPITVSNITSSQCTLNWKLGTAKQYGIFLNTSNISSNQTILTFQTILF